jgi:hypothetical protein
MTRLMKSLAIAVALIVLPSANAQAATHSAVSCSLAAVQTAINAAVHGDIVAIPPCPAGVSWTTMITVTKGITILGAGIGQTVIIDDVSKGGAGCANPAPMPMIEFNVAAPNGWRFSGVTIRGSAPEASTCQIGHLHVAGTSKAWRIDHVRIENLQTAGIRIVGDTWGVVDHCQFEGSRKNGVMMAHPRWGGHSYGDGSWAEPLYLGTERAIYIEDSVFTDLNAVPVGAVDIYEGGRIVFRRNRLTFFSTHGTESTGRARSLRSYEIYDNTFDAGARVDFFAAINVRGGTGVIYNNTFIGDYTSVINVTNHRDSAPYSPWGQCNGSSAYDQNLAGQSGYPCIDQVGRSTGDLLSSNPPTPVRWPNQALEPLYQWGNTKNGAGSQMIQSSASHIQANRDYFDNQVKPGYTAFAYPHPLTLSGAVAPAPPKNLRVVP